MTRDSNSSDGWFLPALTLLLIAFKLLGVIDWSWWWVTAPLWFPIAAVVLLLILFLAVGASVSVGYEVWYFIMRRMK